MHVYSDLIGKEYREIGDNTPGRYDCWELAVEVLKRYDIHVPDYGINCHEYIYINEVIEGKRRENSWYECGKIVPALIVFRPRLNMCGHVGVYIGNNQFIHSTEKKGVCIESLSSILWKNRIDGFYLPKGVEKN
jgi:cell wall-associated NlpC family hydrolase